MKKAKYKHFKCEEGSTTSIYDQAIKFIDQLGEGRLINVTNSDRRGKWRHAEKVTVWYWEEI